MEDCVPVIEISDENFEAMFPAISNAITEASFIALDCELSGLGNRSKLNCSEIDVRYQNTKEIAEEYSIVSLGLSCFACQSCTSVCVSKDEEDETVKTHNYLVQTFNILTLCSTKFVVECDSLKFLLSHGFDFNRQYSHGLSYSRGEYTQKEKEENHNVKSVLQLIIQHKKPIVLHNGFVDLIFLYQSFYADLPKKIEMFAADLLDMFPAGVYDTKYISEYEQLFCATFLEYVFKKLQLENEKRKACGKWHCRISFPPYPRKGILGLGWHPYLNIFSQEIISGKEATQPLCSSYKYHGWCRKGESCKMSHNIDRMVRELSKQNGGRKRRKANTIGHLAVAHLISLKKQKIEQLRRKEETVHGNVVQDVDVDVLDMEEGLRERCGIQQKKHSREDEEGGLRERCGIQQKKHSREDESNPNASDVLINLSSDEDQENDVTILENDDDVIEEVFPTDENNSTQHQSQASSFFEAGELSCQEPSANSNDPELSITDSNFTPAPALVEIQPGIVRSNGTDNFRKKFGGHSAGYDAFMTGFIFCCDVASLGNLASPSTFRDPKEMELHHMVGRVYLIGKDFPFLIRNSAYVGTSASHDRLIKTIRSS